MKQLNSALKLMQLIQLNKEIQHAIRQKNRLYRRYVSGGRNQEDEIILQETTNYISDSSKDSYFTNLGKRLNDSITY